MASISAAAIGAFSFLLCLRGVLASSEMGVIFSNTEGYKQLNSNQRLCAVADVRSPCYLSRCSNKNCFCASPQFMSDETDSCMIALDPFNDGMYSVDTYNGIMAFFGNECGTFNVQFKQVASESIVYTTVFTQTAPTDTAGHVVPTPGSGRSSAGSSETPNPDGNGGENNGKQNFAGNLSVEAIVGIVAGAATVIGTIITAYMCWCR
ncbi:uncharacterized protein B0T15DRAFT_286211 [Chaetomium strumarium]|uniref:Extracellular membrane protein CFEM domain-containing protein n=1 Tax=Chaetomium strumarium TaxID=1170767 RepID=A0AAJ0LZX6_9PEZI|nr:hypothetical protein B0T15DRAFT_286211 [Chaetomium strumarium]